MKKLKKNYYIFLFETSPLIWSCHAVGLLCLPGQRSSSRIYLVRHILLSLHWLMNPIVGRPIYPTSYKYLFIDNVDM